MSQEYDESKNHQVYLVEQDLFESSIHARVFHISQIEDIFQAIQDVLWMAKS